MHFSKKNYREGTFPSSRKIRFNITHF